MSIFYSHSLIFVLMSRPNPLPLFFVCFPSISSQSIRIGFIRFFIESRLLGDRESTLLRWCILGYATSVYHIWLEMYCVYVEICKLNAVNWVYVILFDRNINHIITLIQIIRNEFSNVWLTQIVEILNSLMFDICL